MPSTNPVETRIATILKDKNGILIITMKNCGLVDEFDVIDINLVLRHLSEKNPSYKLLDARAEWRMDAKAKERANLEDSTSKTRARAVVVSGIVKATLIKFLQSFSKKDYPQKTFTDWDEAYEWLLKIKSEK